MLTFSADDHRYQWNGRDVPSVTQVLSLVTERQWFTEDSAWRGSAVHLACEYDDRGELDESTVEPEHLGYLMAWRRFRSDSGFEPHAIEHQVYGKHGYAGTIDRIGTVPSGRLLIDLKTGTPSPATALQTAAYLACLESPLAYGRVAVRLFPDGQYTTVHYQQSHYERDLARFLHCLAVWRTAQEFGIRNN